MAEDDSLRYPNRDEVGVALRRCWQPVARVEDLADGPRRAVLMDEALAVFQKGDGEPAVIADRCAHRGASLSRGAVCGDSLQCPYHGWEWGADGGCTRIPSLADQRQIPPCAGVPSFPVRVQWGLVWTALEEPLGEPPSVPWFDPDAWRWRHGTPFELPVSAGVMIENFRDVAHFAFVHRDTLGAMPEVIEPLAVEREGHTVTMRREMLAGEGSEELWGSLREIAYTTIAPIFTSARLFTNRGERCMLHCARAISATESIHYWLVGLAEGYDEWSIEEVIEAEGRLYWEDRATVSTVQPAELSIDPGGEISTLADVFTLGYRLAFSEFVRQALAR
jgi:nitrite reductase/ring-hydroxylating ferredoxin subunit